LLVLIGVKGLTFNRVSSAAAHWVARCIIYRSITREMVTNEEKGIHAD
jgi:hypothetical protein